MPPCQRPLRLCAPENQASRIEQGCAQWWPWLRRSCSRTRSLVKDHVSAAQVLRPAGSFGAIVASSAVDVRPRVPAGEDVRLAQIHEEERLDVSESHSLNVAQPMLQQRDTLGNPLRECVGVAQASCSDH